MLYDELFDFLIGGAAIAVGYVLQLVHDFCWDAQGIMWIFMWGVWHSNFSFRHYDNIIASKEILEKLLTS